MYKLVRDSDTGCLFWTDDDGRLIVGDQSAKDSRAGRTYGPDYTDAGVRFVDPAPFEALLKRCFLGCLEVFEIFCTHREDGSGTVLSLPTKDLQGHPHSHSCTWEELVWTLQWYHAKVLGLEGSDVRPCCAESFGKYEERGYESFVCSCGQRWEWTELGDLDAEWREVSP